MALNAAEADEVWKRMVAGEVRAMYFGDLASVYTKRKQIITAVSFLTSSGAAATLAARLPNTVPLVFAAISAILTAYSISVNLDGKVAMMAKLHGQWSALSADYERLWNHWYEDEAEAVLGRLTDRNQEVSETGTTEAPFDQSRLDKWSAFVHGQYQDIVA